MAGLALAIQLLEKSSFGVSYLFQIVAFFFHSRCFAFQNDTLVDKGFSIVKVVDFIFTRIKLLFDINLNDNVFLHWFRFEQQIYLDDFSNFVIFLITWEHILPLSSLYCTLGRNLKTYQNASGTYRI